MSFISIPFKAESGLSQYNGVAKFSSAGIVLEFESKFIGLISTGIKEARLPLAELHDVKFKKGFMKRGAKIEIRLKSMAMLAGLPSSEGKVVLKLTADDFDRASEAVTRVREDIAQYSASLPPRHPPLRSLFDESEDETKELR